MRGNQAETDDRSKESAGCRNGSRMQSMRTIRLIKISILAMKQEGQTVVIPALGPLLMLMLLYPFGFLFEMVGEVGLILLERRDFEEKPRVSNKWAGGRNYR
jgi:hypothetical protein